MQFQRQIKDLKNTLRELRHLRGEYWNGEVPLEIAERHLNLQIKINQLEDILTFKNK